jgi:hypothetical protein
MANNDRWKDDQERNRYRDDDRRSGDRGQGYGPGSDYEGDGSIARRGFGNESSGYARDYGSDDRGRRGRGPKAAATSMAEAAPTAATTAVQA